MTLNRTHLSNKTRFVNRLYPYSPQTDRYWFAIIIVIAVLLRVLAAFFLGNEVVALPGTFDQVSYDMLARQVLSGQGFTVTKPWWPLTPAGAPTAHWSYLYTLYLAAVYGLFGYHPLAARLIQAALAGFLMPWLVYRLGRRSFGSKAGLVAAGLSAVYIYFVYYAATVMTETFYIIAILGVLDLAGQLGQASPVQESTVDQPTGSKLLWLWLGMALGVAVLLRQVFLLFIPVLFIWLLWRSYRYQARSVMRMLGILAGSTAVLVLLILPWTARNYRAFNSFVLLNTNAGFAFFWGNHPIHGYNFIPILPADGPSYQDLIPPELRNLNEADLDRALLKLSLAQIKADPVRYLVLSLSRVQEYVKFWPSSDSGLISNISRVFSFGLLLPFMGYGLALGFRRSLSAEALILYLFMVTYAGTHLLTWTLIRYRLPIDAVLLVFAGLALVDLWERLARRYAKTKNAPTPVSLHVGD
ncbi:MAG: glycosyltransferase family 39 protein [Anaerolineae bacterium]|nr:glycosyltransferase family 39 protein [Anaerolineae bacterium]